MSVRVMAAVWALDIPGTEKLVLLALADWANDEGRCWPSMQQLATKSGLTDRAVRGIIGRLVDRGFVSRKENPGKGVMYFVTPGTSFPPEARSPRNETAQTPERRSANTSGTINNTPKKARGSSLPANFEPELSGKTGAVVAGWPPGMLDAEIDQFRDHHTAKGTISKDWQASFRTWARNAEKWRAKDGQRNGNRNGGSASGMGRTIDAAQRFVARGGPH
jgi:hypothetical protein